MMDDTNFPLQPPDQPPQAEPEPPASPQEPAARPLYDYEDTAPSAPVVLVDGVSEAPSDGTPQRDFEDLTLAEMVGQFFRAPGSTWNALRQVAQTPLQTPTAQPITVPVMPTTAIVTAKKKQPLAPATAEAQRIAVRFSLYFVAFLVAWWGCSILADSPIRDEADALYAGTPMLIAGFLIWIGAEIYGNWQGLRQWFARVRQRGKTEAIPPNPDAALPELAAVRPYEPIVQSAAWEGIHPARIFMALGGLFFAFAAWQGTAHNQFTPIGFYSWMVSVILWTLALGLRPGWVARGIANAFGRLRQTALLRSWTFWALVAIMILGGIFRLGDLQGVPPEMTSDHVEKILDSQRVLDGNQQVFFPNNGGREPAQMYLMALFSQLPGMSMNFTTLKLLAILESMITLPVMWWMGREIMGDREPQLGNIVGLLLAALVAASYWDTAITRLSLRIILTPLVTALLLICLSRALRTNKREYFILSGLVLGFGLYTYQATRMLPLVVIAGAFIVVVFKAHTWRERGRWVVNFIALVIVSFVAFVPLFGFSIDPTVNGPTYFWMRTFGRMLGDDIIQTKDAQGNIVERNATWQERIDAFNKNIPALASNIRNALLMYNWKGDVAWISSAPNYPALDTFSGALLIIGVGAWLARMVRRRDVVDWLMPLAFLIMILPSALAIASTNENPSATRMSGSLPQTYLFCALPLGLMVDSIRRVAAGRSGVVLGTGLSSIIVLGSFAMNANTYFGAYRQSYIESSLPYSEAGRILKGFAESDGSFGNAFMIAYPYWWDHRAVGLEAGLVDWPNGIVSLSDVPKFIYDAFRRPAGNKYIFDPDKDILFFYSQDDHATEAQLQAWFPAGRATVIKSYQPGHDFKIYRVPWLGTDGMMDYLRKAGVQVLG